MKIHHLYIVVFVVFSFHLLGGCKAQKEGNKLNKQSIIDRQEARDDSLELVAAFERQSKIIHQVQPAFETDAVEAEASFDAADDPAVWVNSADPTKSVIIGSNKKGGIYLYDLNGKTIAYFPVGNINNVDVLYGFDLGDRKVDLVGGSNRSDQSIDLYTITDNGKALVDIADGPLKIKKREIDDIYGFCFYQSKKDQRSYVFVNGKNGRVQQFELIATDEGKIAANKVRDVKFDSQVEGMVTDPLYGWLYVGEENRGIWKLGAEPTAGDTKTLIEMSTVLNPAISFDIEGLTLYEKGSGGYLLASSQGNFSYAVFEREGKNAYITSFIVTNGTKVDGIEETDGIEAINTPLGPLFPKGIFIAQDGFNYDGDVLEAQNFKIVDWQMIEDVLK